MPRRASLLTAAVMFAVTPAGAAPPAQSPRVVVISPARSAASQAALAPQSRPNARAVPVISLSVKDADLVEVVRSLARIASVNLVIDPRVQGKVTAELVDVRWDHALAAILKTQGLAMELDGQILTVAEPRRLFRSTP